MQLLKITTTPIKYELEVEQPVLEYQQDVTPSCDMTTSASKLSVRSKNADIQIDTYEARKSLGLINLEDGIKQYTEKSKAHITKLIQQYVQTGKELGEIQDGIDIGDIIRQRILEQPILYTTALPSTGADISCEPATLDIRFEPGDVSVDWQIEGSSCLFQPGSIKMKIVQYPDVNIEYLGGPMYVPPSANPNYEESIEI